MFVKWIDAVFLELRRLLTDGCTSSTQELLVANNDRLFFWNVCSKDGSRIGCVSLYTCHSKQNDTSTVSGLYSIHMIIGWTVITSFCSNKSGFQLPLEIHKYTIFWWSNFIEFLIDIYIFFNRDAINKSTNSNNWLFNDKYSHVECS